MSGLEKREYRKLKRVKSEVRKIRKKLNTTLGWLDLKEIGDDYMLAGEGSSSQIIKGIKLTPHNIFIDSETEIIARFENIRHCLNKAPDHLYYAFVYSPINADVHINYLNRAYERETDPVCLSMIEDDLNKVYDFQQRYKEIEFFVMIRDHSNDMLEDRMEELISAFKYGEFRPQRLNKRDFYNYVQFLFENPLITDYHFSRGLFSMLNREMIYDAETDQYVVKDSTDDMHAFGSPMINVVPENISFNRSRLAPTSLKLHYSYLEIGDKYVAILLMTQLPQIYPEGILCQYLGNPKLKVFMKTDRYKGDYSKMLIRRQSEMEEQARKTSDPIQLERINSEIQSHQDYVNQVVRDNDVTHNVTVTFVIYADSYEEMKEMREDLVHTLNSGRFNTVNPKFKEEQTFKMMTPLWTRINLEQVIQDNYGVLLPSRSLGGLYPFVFETLKDPEGFLLGHELQNAGIILWDPGFYYKHPEEASLMNRINGNTIVCGKSGSGKTTMMDLTIRHFIKDRMRIIWVDPENNNIQMTQKYGGTVVDWGRRNNIINIFDLKPLSTEEDEDDAAMWDTELAIKQVTEDVNTIFSFLFPEISEDTLALTGELVKATYQSVGIRPDTSGQYRSFKGIGKDRMPTFADFYDVLKKALIKIEGKPGFEYELSLLNNLEIKMRRIMNEWSIYFVGHTTVELPEDRRQILSFATKKLFNAPENLQNALYYIMFKYAWTLCLDPAVHSAFIIDEAHTMILKDRITDLVAQFFRRSRKYYNIMLIGTQEPHDFADPKYLTQGKAMFNNAAYKVILGLEQDACIDINKLTSLNSNEANLLMRFTRGEALLICGNRRIPIAIDVTANELMEMGGGYEFIHT